MDDEDGSEDEAQDFDGDEAEEFSFDDMGDSDMDEAELEASGIKLPKIISQNVSFHKVFCAKNLLCYRILHIILLFSLEKQT